MMALLTNAQAGDFNKDYKKHCADKPVSQIKVADFFSSLHFKKGKAYYIDANHRKTNKLVKSAVSHDIIQGAFLATTKARITIWRQGLMSCMINYDSEAQEQMLTAIMITSWYKGYDKGAPKRAKKAIGYEWDKNGKLLQRQEANL